MNQAQKKLVAMWGGFLLLTVIASVNHRWVLDNWDWLRWPVFAAILSLAARGGKETMGWGEPGKKLSDFLKSYPMLKGWVVFYVLCVLLFLAYGLVQGIEFHKSPGSWLLLGFGPLFLPLLVVAEYQRYKRLGIQSNHRFNKDASR